MSWICYEVLQDTSLVISKVFQNSVENSGTEIRGQEF